MRSSVKFGLLFAAVAAGIKLVIWFTGNEYTKIDIFSHPFRFILLIGIMAWGIRHKKKQDGGYITFKNVIKEGLAIGATGAVFFCIYLFFHTSYINTAGKEKYVQESMAHIQKDGETKKAEQKLIDQNKQQFLTNMAPFRHTTNTLFGLLIFSFISSIICSTFLIENPPLRPAE